MNPARYCDIVDNEGKKIRYLSRDAIFLDKLSPVRDNISASRYDIPAGAFLTQGPEQRWFEDFVRVMRHHPYWALGWGTGRQGALPGSFGV